ncbi:hypothetical protein DPEC_G00272180 [Dallia pectoralis]|uniref:Uncharacterized protein n=1 Tax=Dallia pectoralis TaxID=75939 RepID=A0ACC2FPR6_DALPE|nr:hypothetical protein DPEC_G00272180 [Dallia pectoralis]
MCDTPRDERKTNMPIDPVPVGEESPLVNVQRQDSGVTSAGNKLRRALLKSRSRALTLLLSQLPALGERYTLVSRLIPAAAPAGSRETIAHPPFSQCLANLNRCCHDNSPQESGFYDDVRRSGSGLVGSERE